MNPTDPYGGLVAIDDDYDPDYASDGVSRFGAYLRHDPWLSDPHEQPCPVGFAATVWRIANSPVMSPGYVRVRRDLADVTAHPSEDVPGLLVITVTAPLGWPRGLAGDPAVRGWRGWDRPRSYDDGPDAYRDPADDRPAILLTARLHVSLGASELPTPAPARGGAVDLRAARNACAVITAHVNATAGPMLAALREVNR